MFPIANDDFPQLCKRLPEGIIVFGEVLSFLGKVSQVCFGFHVENGHSLAVPKIALYTETIIPSLTSFVTNPVTTLW